ncbi:MAG: MBL fold metallo-hydrolase [Candidatus Accumulibacter sp.]|jgi:L-ascorbate metabolism protein UlaG (beta-lactamase superfamily)|nr:MBL fold metallo-hydrolase [Accumulibacter sp.]
MAGKLLRRTLASLAGLALLAAVAGCHLMRALGEAPSEAEVAAYGKLPYFRDGRFQSPESLPFHPDRSTGRGPSSWLRFALPNPNAPDAPLPKLLLDASSFAAVPADLAAWWLGHSSLIIELEGKRLLVDPVFGNAAPIPGVVRRFTDAPIERDELPPLDYVLITHDHYDHLEYATIRALREKDVQFVVPYGVGAHLRKWGIDAGRIHEIGWGETYGAGDLVVASERTNHFSGRTLGRRNTTLWTSYSLKGRRYRVFISGDSGYGEHFRDIGAKHGPFDLAFIEIDGWNPGWPKTHMFPEEAVRASLEVGARAMVPVHWGVFDLARHPWDESIRMVADLAAKNGVRLLTPRMGEKLIPGETVTGAWWETVAAP